MGSKGGGLLDVELVRQLAQTGDTYHGTPDPKHSFISLLLTMTLIAIAVIVAVLLLLS